MVAYYARLRRADCHDVESFRHRLSMLTEAFRPGIASMENEPMSAPLPLQGVRILTLEQVHALPWGTAFLADLGAQVIRIESVEHLQDRKAGPFPNGKAGP